MIGIEFNPVRIGFKTDTSKGVENDGFQVFVDDILNLGVKPSVLITLVKSKFLSLGGKIYENSAVEKIDIFSNCAVVTTAGENGFSLSSRVVLDCMGNNSPISKQIRGPIEPDGICIVVGSCASGYNAENNTYSDVIYTDTPITVKEDSELQYFWEAFPAGSSPIDRTTYLFTYMDAKKERPSVAEVCRMMDCCMCLHL